MKELKEYNEMELEVILLPLNDVIVTSPQEVSEDEGEENQEEKI